MKKPSSSSRIPFYNCSNYERVDRAWSAEAQLQIAGTGGSTGPENLGLTAFSTWPTYSATPKIELKHTFGTKGDLYITIN